MRPWPKFARECFVMFMYNDVNLKDSFIHFVISHGHGHTLTCILFKCSVETYLSESIMWLKNKLKVVCDILLKAHLFAQQKYIITQGAITQSKYVPKKLIL